MALTAATNRLVWLIELKWNGSVQARYARYDDNITVSTGDYAGTYTALPELRIKTPEITGEMREENGEIWMPSNVDPAYLLTPQREVGTIQCWIHRCETADPAGTIQNIFFGQLGDLHENETGKTGMVRLTIEGLKTLLLRANLGYKLLTTCPYRFGNHLCQIDVPSLAETATVTALTTNSVKNRLTLDSGDLSTLTELHWKRGRIEYQGLSLRITDASFEDGRFTLDDTPPSTWNGAEVTIYPGCDKQLATCAGQWNNEANHGAIGRATPARNPTVEDTR